jgi:hypothetical protein
MRLLLAVLDDLFQFARSAVFGVFFEPENKRASSYEVLQIPSPQLSLPLLPQSRVDLSSTTSNETNFDVSAGSAYFIGERDVALYVDPVIAFDGVITKLTYGDIVLVIKFGGRWAHVKIGNTEGWILKDMLREQLSDVFPTFQEGTVYQVDNEETVKLRLCIEDVFNGGVSGMPLTDVEYVLYTLHRKNVTISWPSTRPRVAGSWQKILRGKEGIHIGIIPKIGSVMEYIVEDQGHICYVEAVFGDDTIKIRGIGLLEESMFSVFSMNKEEWRELRPVFIELA